MGIADVEPVWIKRGVARYNWQTGKWEWRRAAEGIEILNAARRFPPP
jgi:hypothetical protein